MGACQSVALEAVYETHESETALTSTTDVLLEDRSSTLEELGRFSDEGINDVEYVSPDLELETLRLAEEKAAAEALVEEMRLKDENEKMAEEEEIVRTNIENEKTLAAQFTTMIPRPGRTMKVSRHSTAQNAKAKIFVNICFSHNIENRIPLPSHTATDSNDKEVAVYDYIIPEYTYLDCFKAESIQVVNFLCDQIIDDINEQFNESLDTNKKKLLESRTYYGDFAYDEGHPVDIHINDYKPTNHSNRAVDADILTHWDVSIGVPAMKTIFLNKASQLTHNFFDRFFVLCAGWLGYYENDFRCDVTSNMYGTEEVLPPYGKGFKKELLLLGYELLLGQESMSEIELEEMVAEEKEEDQKNFRKALTLLRSGGRNSLCLIRRMATVRSYDRALLPESYYKQADYIWMNKGSETSELDITLWQNQLVKHVDFTKAIYHIAHSSFPPIHQVVPHVAKEGPIVTLSDAQYYSWLGGSYEVLLKQGACTKWNFLGKPDSRHLLLITSPRLCRNKLAYFDAKSKDLRGCFVWDSDNSKNFPVLTPLGDDNSKAGACDLQVTGTLHRTFEEERLQIHMERDKTIRFRFKSARERDEWMMAIEECHKYFDQEAMVADVEMDKRGEKEEAKEER